MHSGVTRFWRSCEQHQVESSHHKRVRTAALPHADLTPAEIANQVGVTHRTVYNIKNWLDVEEGIEQRPGQGRKCPLD